MKLRPISSRVSSQETLANQPSAARETNQTKPNLNSLSLMRTLQWFTIVPLGGEEKDKYRIFWESNLVVLRARPLKSMGIIGDQDLPRSHGGELKPVYCTWPPRAIDRGPSSTTRAIRPTALFFRDTTPFYHGGRGTHEITHWRKTY
ncbi:hypothetical protein CDAR_447691 [Caerostris darwini]|uniref:Uncharacterized protein n=1 Tax=Caerostris darwini TaxID=1538125 RepID=A0AAV4PTP4_9ARAC|nr:hypothetical protein CDAR_447691 [Caerostris darwini]